MTTTPYTHCQPDFLLETVGGDREIFLELAEIFARESNDGFAKLTLAAKAGDIGQIGYQSHSFKGTVGPLGASALVDMLATIEEECEQGQCVCDDHRLAHIAQELQQVQREMAHYVAHF